MSFTATVKSEVLDRMPKNGCCMHNFFAGMASIGGSYKIEKSGISYVFATENQLVGDTFETLCETLFMIKPERYAKSSLITYKIPEASMFLKELDIISEKGALMRTPENLPDCCVRAFISGAFVCGGSMTSPQKRYHLEFVTSHFHLNNGLIEMFERFDIPAKYVVRKSKYVVYFKDNEIIGDVLALINANNAVWELSNTNILKSIANRENRITNCEEANIGRVVNASIRQQEAIKFIDEKFGIDNLSPQLAEAARMRMKYPDISITELGQMFEPPLSKSGINHRMRKLVQFAQELKENI